MVWYLITHRNSFTLHLPHSYQNLSPADGLCIFVNVCIFLHHYLSPQHVPPPISLLVSHCESLSAFLVGQSHSSWYLLCAGHQIWRGEEIAHVKFMSYPFCSPSQTSYCCMCSCHHLCWVLLVLCKVNFSCHMYILSYFRVCKSLCKCVCFLGINIMNLQVP
jgi:hypothetical protein